MRQAALTAAAFAAFAAAAGARHAGGGPATARDAYRWTCWPARQVAITTVRPAGILPGSILAPAAIRAAASARNWAGVARLNDGAATSCLLTVQLLSQPAPTATALALIPSEASFSFAPAIPLSRWIETDTVPSEFWVTANAGELLAAPSTRATAVPMPASPSVVPASMRGRDRHACLAAGLDLLQLSPVLAYEPAPETVFELAHRSDAPF